MFFVGLYIKVSAHDEFLEKPSSGTLKITFIRDAQNRKTGKPNNFGGV
jgi:hypothetical protein